MTIVRVGLAETRNYGDGWDAIFAKKPKESKPAKASGSRRKKAKPAKKKK